ncbi:MAG: hypothetical protein NTZ19_10400 [Bacteroidetes bacterium]|nr:hypothetical protein [Bacteroidota bacterium]
MKKIALLFIIVFSVTLVNSQVHINTFIVGGVSLPNFKYSYDKVSSPRSIYQGYTGGLLASTGFMGGTKNNMMLNFGLNYLQAGAVDKAPTSTTFVESKIRLNYLQGEFFISLPISLLEICGGFYYNYAISGKKTYSKADGTSTTTDLKFGNQDGVDDAHRDDFGLSLKTIINVSKVKFILGYNKGLFGISANALEDVYNKTYSISIAYPLGKKQ